MIGWLLKLLGLGPRSRPANRGGSRITIHAVRPADHAARDESHAHAEEKIPFPENSGHLNPDGHHADDLASDEQRTMAHIAARVEKHDYVLPQLPSTSMAVLDMTSSPTTSAKKIVRAMEGDPVLTSELLRAANSVMFAGARPAETLQQAVVRLGLRNLRSLILGLSMKAVLSRQRGVAHYAQEVWRQAASVGRISRTIAETSGDDPDKAFLVGLLCDIGKVPLLDMVGKTAKSRQYITLALIGRVFHQWHEIVGAQMASEWSLPEEVASVAGNHHAFETNQTHPRAAAIASLAHKIDLHLCFENEEPFWALASGREFEILGVESWRARKAIRTCLEAFVNHEDTAAKERAATSALVR